MVRSIRRIELALLTATFLVAASPARADGAAAEKLFLEGKRLMAEGQNALACETFQSAHDLDPTATGTLLNLALCHETIGRNATAWAEFRQVIGESSGRRQDRVDMAREHEARLAPLLSYVTIRVSPEARLEGLRIEMDQRRPIAEASWGVELPVDPGKHRIDVSAPDRLPEVIEIDIGATADRKAIDVPVLQLAPEPERPREAPPVQTVTADWGRWRTLGYVLGGAGILSLGATAVVGAIAIGQKSDFDKAAEACPGRVCIDGAARDKATDAYNDANRTATVANITGIVGAGLLVAGAVIVVVSPSAKSQTTAFGVSPQRGDVALSLSRFW